MKDRELVVLLRDDLVPIGSALKNEVHTKNTPLHLAFSCYLFNDNDEVLITRRALSKRTWPGVWTNSFCGHPGPDESAESAIHRRASHELGAVITEPTVVLANFSYRAVDASGIVENEFCPVYVSSASSEVAPNPDEVSEHVWVSLPALQAAVANAPYAFSPWLVEQLPGVAEALRARAETSVT